MDDNNVTLHPKIEAAVTALMTAVPKLTRQQAVFYLLHSPSGRSLAEYLADTLLKSNSNEAPPMKRDDELRAIAKKAGVIALAKLMVEDNRAYGITEHEFTQMLTEHAQVNRLKGETAVAAFARIFSDPDNVDLRKAHNLTKSYPNLMQIKPVQVGGSDALDVNTDQSKAMEQLKQLAEEQRKRAPWLSADQAFARVFEAAENAELAAKAHRRPAATTSYAFPR